MPEKLECIIHRFVSQPGVLLHDLDRFSINQSINQSIKTHFYSAICCERIRGAFWFDEEIKYYWKADIHTGSRNQVNVILN